MPRRPARTPWWKWVGALCQFAQLAFGLLRAGGAFDTPTVRALMLLTSAGALLFWVGLLFERRRARRA